MSRQEPLRVASLAPAVRARYRRSEAQNGSPGKATLPAFPLAASHKKEISAQIAALRALHCDMILRDSLKNPREAIQMASNALKELCMPSLLPKAIERFAKELR